MRKKASLFGLCIHNGLDSPSPSAPALVEADPALLNFSLPERGQMCTYG